MEFFNLERHRPAPYDLAPASFDSTGLGFQRCDYLANDSRDLSESRKSSLLANAFDDRDNGNFVGECEPFTTAPNNGA